MAGLTDLKVKNTYKSLLRVTDNTDGVDATAKYIGDGEGTNSAMSISTSSVGIGTITPNNPLAIEDTCDAADDATQVNFALMIRNNSDVNEEAGIGFRISSSQTSSQTPGGAITHERTGTSSIGNLNFKTAPSVGTLTTRMIIDKDGRIGIGLTPTANMTGLAIEAGVLTLKETSNPTADTNYGKIFTKSDNKLWFQTGGGVLYEIDMTIFSP